jgi:D-serine deaminase-like pyridoxal phosphate-dependent protein
MKEERLIGLPLDSIPTPALVVEVDTMEKNIEAMRRYLAKTPCSIRPHAKTHKTPAIGHIQMKAGAIGQCCATIDEAEAMVTGGLDHIFLASQVVSPDKIRRLVGLAQQAEVIAAVDDEANLENLSEAVRGAGHLLGVVVDIDVGMGRCGVQSIERAVELARKAYGAAGIAFRGVFGYEGHAVAIKNRDERTRVGRKANAYLVKAAETIRGAGIPVEIVTAGGTGTFDIAAEYPGITEIEAGSYIFMDSSYSKLDLPFKQSLTVLTTVLSRPTEDRVVFDVGMKGISVERAMPIVQNHRGIEIQKLSEAHATGEITDSAVNPRPGERYNLIPSHCCTTVNLYDVMFGVRDARVEAVWPITGRGA